MMDVQLKEIQTYLEQNGFESVYVKNPEGDYLFVDIVVKGEEIRLKCTFPISFPYTFPEIYILKEFYKKYKPIPHIQDFRSKDGYICIFDSNTSYPNFNMLREVTLECIKKAQQIILDGIEKNNIEDFRNEFLSYWELDSSSTTADLIFKPQSYPMELYCYKRNDKRLYLSDDKEKLLNYLIYTKGWNIKTSNLINALFLPIEDDWYPPFPNSNIEVINKLKSCKHYKDYIKYLKNNRKQHIVVFSQTVNNNVCLAGWIHEKVKTPNGFRTNNVVPEFFYGYLHKDDKIKKFTINHLSNERLFERGGDGNIKEDIKVSITGCGSIGSYLTKTLIDLGLNKFILIDKDILLSENIARHYCGASSIGKSKVVAIKEAVIKHFPDTCINAIEKNIFSIFKDDIDVLNECDYNFVVVGHIPTEMKFIQLFNEGKIKKPLIIIWVEPYIMGGHAIILQNKQKDIIDNILVSQTKNILSNGEEYIKRESGCGSTFLPYSAFEVQQFLNSIMDYINQNIFEKRSKNNYYLSWCGRLSLARKNRMKINPQWLGEENRKLRVEVLEYENI